MNNNDWMQSSKFLITEGILKDKYDSLKWDTNIECKKLIERIKSIPNVKYTGAATNNEYNKAVLRLGTFGFSLQYTAYLLTFGCISFHGTEWTGLNPGADHTNVVTVTEYRRKNDIKFKKINTHGYFYVIEELGETFIVGHSFNNEIYEVKMV